MVDQRETTLIYQMDSYRRECDATVVAVDPTTRAITLDETVFYPTGGGQPHDTGTVTADGWRAGVVEVRKAGTDVLHILTEGTDLPEPGALVTGQIDWERRYALMRMHTALHVLCGTVFRDYGSLVTGGNMTPDHARMDFEMDSADFTPERVAEIERHANAEIAAERDVHVRILPREEALAIPDLIRTRVNLLPPDIARIRTVEVVGLDLQADGGTHVANTREVGTLTVTGTRSKGKRNKRLEISLTTPSAPPAPTLPPTGA